MKLTTTLVAGVLALTGCTTKNYYSEDLEPLPTSKPPVTVRRTTTTIPTFGEVSEIEFLNSLREQSEGARIMDDEDLLAAGWATCFAFDDGLSALDVVGAMTQTMGEDPTFDAMLLATASLATVWLCPEYINIWSD